MADEQVQQQLPLSSNPTSQQLHEPMQQRPQNFINLKRNNKFEEQGKHIQI